MTIRAKGEAPPVREIAADDAGAARLLGDHIAAERPLLLRGAAAHWPALQRWGFDDLVRSYGDVPLLVEETRPRGEGVLAGRKRTLYPFREVEMTVAAYVAALRSDPTAKERLYFAEKDVPAAMQVDVPGSVFLDDATKMSRVAFLGASTFTSGHYHGSEQQALLVQVVGTKRVVVFDREELDDVYLRPWYAKSANWSEVPFALGTATGDYAALHADYPRLRRTHPQLAVLQPGDALHIPPCALHVVHGEGENASVTYFYRSPRGRRGFLRREIAQKLLHRAITRVGAVRAALARG